jgi:hypothetical protein
MKLTEKRRQELIAQGDIVSVKGREYIALDVLDTPVDLAAVPGPQTNAEQPAQPARQVRSKDGGKTELEGSAGSS